VYRVAERVSASGTSNCLCTIAAMSVPSPRRSRCTYPRAAPLEWVFYNDVEHPSEVALVAWIESQLPFNQTFIIGQIEALRELASQGLLEYPDRRLDAIRHEPEIYELRWKLLTTMVRQYHGEPKDFDGHLIKLHSHIKKQFRSRHETTRAQDGEIAQAALQYQKGEPESWGI
jgi:hypothetical protein